MSKQRIKKYFRINCFKMKQVKILLEYFYSQIYFAISLESSFLVTQIFCTLFCLYKLCIEDENQIFTVNYFNNNNLNFIPHIFLIVFLKSRARNLTGFSDMYKYLHVQIFKLFLSNCFRNKYKSFLLFLQNQVQICLNSSNFQNNFFFTM